MSDLPIRDDFYVVDKRDPVRKVQGTIDGDRDDVPVLADEGAPFGVLNERGMVQSRLNLDEKLSEYAVGTKLLSPEASVDEAVELVLTSGLRWVPVADGGEAVGVVAAQDLLLALLRGEEGRGRTAWELSREVPVLGEDQTLGEAIRAFREEAGVVHVLPVVDGQGALSGVLHRRTVIQAQETVDSTGNRPFHKDSGGEQPGPQESRSDWPVDGLSSASFGTVGPDDGPGAVAETVEDFGFAVVVEERRPDRVLTPLTGLRALRG